MLDAIFGVGTVYAGEGDGGRTSAEGTTPSDILFWVNQYTKHTELLPYQGRAVISGVSAVLSGDAPFESIGKIAGGIIGGGLGGMFGAYLQPFVPEAPGLPFWFGVGGAKGGSLLGGKFGRWFDTQLDFSSGEAY